MTRWSDDNAKVLKVAETIRATYSDPEWGLKASSSDVIHDVCEALSIDTDDADPDALGEKLWEWECEAPSPFAEGLASLVTDGLQPGSTVPMEEIAGEGEMDEWEMRRARFILDCLESAVV